jgi:hypothetical protein
MEKGLKELLESAVLSDETKAALSEAWESKLDEVRANLREEESKKLREEFASRFAADKLELVEAMDRMLNDAVKSHATKAAAELKGLQEERTRLTSAIKEARAEYKAKIASQSQVIESFLLNTLRNELTEFAQDHQALRAQRVKVAEEAAALKSQFDAKLAESMEKLQTIVVGKLHEEITELKTQQKALAEAKADTSKKLVEHRSQLNTETQKGIKMLESFVMSQLNKELMEFEQDKKNLVEARVRFASEAKAKMEETRKSFVARATKIVESTVDSHLRKELTQLKEDLVEARQNIFGRRLFEAFQSEFMASYLSEGTQVKKLSNQLQEAQAKLDEAAKAINDKAKLIESMERRVKLSEERALRERTLNELLSPLSKDKRVVMGELLESVQTQSLKVAFHKYLPTILNENDRGSSQKGRQLLSETPVTAKRPTSSEVTGDRNNRLTESARAENVEDNVEEILELRRLAGIEK